MRPDKPEHASAIGFSDSLWEITRRCWDSEMVLRPKVGEVVTHLTEAAVEWDKLMPPCSRVEGATPSPEEVSDPMESQEIAAGLFREPHDDPHAARISPHPDQRHEPPLFQLPQKKWKGPWYYLRKVLGFFGFWR